jgi:tRNA nucleotidyltransferase/poly(A) polymerase
VKAPFLDEGKIYKMIKLIKLLTENKEERAMEDLLSKIVKQSPFSGKVYIAGGYVRDKIMGIDSKDIDLVVELPQGGIKFAEWICKKYKVYKKGSNPVIFPTYGTAKFQLYGVKHKGVNVGEIEIEAVMTRTEKYEKGNRKPEVKAGTLAQDVERRDFTVNSLLKDLTTGEIHDLTGMGKADIKRGVVQTPLNPDIIFAEDALRMLRAIRFTVKYGWDLPLFMIKAIKRNARMINSISNECIHEELNKMLVSKNPKQAIKLMKVTGLMKEVLPELELLIGLKQNKYHK